VVSDFIVTDGSERIRCERSSDYDNDRLKPLSDLGDQFEAFKAASVEAFRPELAGTHGRRAYRKLDPSGV
jgi:hypothetical protein